MAQAGNASHMPAGTRLDCFRNFHALTFQELAKRLHVSRSMAFRLCRGERTPGLVTAARIERLTGIPAASWAKEADAHAA